MIFVFKTSVTTKTQIKVLKPHLDQVLHNAKWTFDLEDCDKILRIDSEENITPQIKRLFHMHTFICEELE